MKLFKLCRALVLVLGVAGYFWLAPRAWAGDEHHKTPVPSTTVTQSQSANAAGGYAEARGGDGSSSVTTVGLAYGAPIPPQCPPGLVPGRRGKRGLYVGVVGLSAVCVAPDASQAEAIKAQWAHEEAMLRLQVELAAKQAEAERAATERIRAEGCYECGARK